VRIYSVSFLFSLFSLLCNSITLVVVDSLRTNKRNFHHMFRITKLVSLARHTHIFFDRVGSIHAASFKFGNTWNNKMRYMKIITSFERDCLARGNIHHESANSSKTGSNIRHQYVERSSPNHNWRKMQLTTELLCRIMHSRIWPHHKGTALSRPLRNGRRITMEDHCCCITESAQNRKPNISWSSSVQRQSSRPAASSSSSGRLPTHLDPHASGIWSGSHRFHLAPSTLSWTSASTSSLLQHQSSRPTASPTYGRILFFHVRPPCDTGLSNIKKDAPALRICFWGLGASFYP
jgi:hypothetical protein